jgi:hypothetical protein
MRRTDDSPYLTSPCDRMQSSIIKVASMADITSRCGLPGFGSDHPCCLKTIWRHL